MKAAKNRSMPVSSVFIELRWAVQTNRGGGACVCYPPKLFSAFWLSAHSTVKSYTNSSDVRLKNLSNPVRNALFSRHKVL